MTIYSFIALISYMSGTLHAFHISVCEMELDKERQSLEISQRIFLDDLEEALILWSGQNGVNVIDPKDKNKLDSMVENYFMSHIEIAIDDMTRVPSYLGSQIRGDVMIMFVEVPKVKKLKKLEVKNSVLTEVFTDQVNLIHVTRGGKLKSLKLDSSQPSGIINWE